MYIGQNLVHGKALVQIHSFLFLRGLPWWLSGEFIYTAGDTGDPDSVPGLGRSPGGGNGNLLQVSCLEYPVDRRAWQAVVHRVTKSWMLCSWMYFARPWGRQYLWVFVGSMAGEWVKWYRVTVISFIPVSWSFWIPPSTLAQRICDISTCFSIDHHHWVQFPVSQLRTTLNDSKPLKLAARFFKIQNLW